MAITGIDPGTSNAAAAVLRGGSPVIIPSAEGIDANGILNVTAKDAVRYSRSPTWYSEQS
jgi:molecular chaperone DnaK (HSP70)